MSIIGILIFAGLIFVAVLVNAEARKQKDQGKYRGIRWVFKLCRKKDWRIPEWIHEQAVFRTWVLLLVGSGFLVAAGITEILMQGKTVTQIKRPEYGEGIRQTELSLEWESEGSRKKKDVTVNVKEKNLTEKEKQEIFQGVKERLGEIILGENKSADHINRPLMLPDKLDDFPVTIQWISSDSRILNWEGHLGKNIPEKGTLICLTGIITLGDQEDRYFKYVKVYPPLKTEEEELEELLKTADEEGDSSWMKLPDSYQGKRLSWKEKGENALQSVALLTFLCSVFFLMRDKQTLQEKRKKEKQQMIVDYPEILSKLTLLLGAGINLRKAMERIGKDYVGSRKEGAERKAYEVIVEICQEMDRGVPEKKAYEDLGEKCGLLYYRTLSALLIQHLQKGSRDMGRILEEEASKAQEMRRQQARILGEQASTKLLIPMILMLLVVFVILIVPAWFAFIV